MKTLSLIVLLLSISPASRADEAAARQIERLSSVVMTSPYGNIARVQATLTLVCDQEGLSKALEEQKQKELLNLMLQKKVVWANGDSPALINTLTSELVTSYAEGLLRLASGLTPTGKAIKLALCQTAAADANSILQAKSKVQP